VLIGTSLGGMLASEMSEILNPDHVILLASAKNKDELPFKYTFQRYFPVYKLVGGRALIKRQNNATHL
jgi:esterase/lipase